MAAVEIQEPSYPAPVIAFAGSDHLPIEGHVAVIVTDHSGTYGVTPTVRAIRVTAYLSTKPAVAEYHDFPAPLMLGKYDGDGRSQYKVEVKRQLPTDIALVAVIEYAAPDGGSAWSAVSLPIGVDPRKVPLTLDAPSPVMALHVADRIEIDLGSVPPPAREVVAVVSMFDTMTTPVTMTSKTFTHRMGLLMYCTGLTGDIFEVALYYVETYYGVRVRGPAFMFGLNAGALKNFPPVVAGSTQVTVKGGVFPLATGESRTLVLTFPNRGVDPPFRKIRTMAMYAPGNGVSFAPDSLRETQWTRIDTFEYEYVVTNAEVSSTLFAVLVVVEDHAGATSTHLVGRMPSGEKGDKGDKGDKGEYGGPVGPKGDTGATGATGPKGDQGIQGIQGIKGDTGDTGPRGPGGGETGATGPAGPKGDTGLKGDQGIQGIKGDKGEKGDQGIQGIQGPSQGPVGPAGPAGPQGPQATVIIQGVVYFFAGEYGSLLSNYPHLQPGLPPSVLVSTYNSLPTPTQVGIFCHFLGGHVKPVSGALEDKFTKVLECTMDVWTAYTAPAPGPP